MSDNNRPVLAVLGATGAQGGGLVRAALTDPERRFAVRAITRRPESARHLAAMGAEVVAADLDDPATVAAAFDGAHGVFGLTNFWEHLDADREIRQARAIADAARRAGVAHVVWSTLEDVRRWVPLDDDRIPTLEGRFKVPHMDAKAEADAFFADLPTTYLLTSFYWENLFSFGIRQSPFSDLVFSLPLGEVPVPGIASADIGACALGVFERREAMIGRRVGVSGEHVTGAAMAAALGEQLGRDVAYVPMRFEDLAATPIPGAAELANMFHAKVLCNDAYRAARSVDLTRKLHPGACTFAEWAKANIDQVPIL